MLCRRALLRWTIVLHLYSAFVVVRWCFEFSSCISCGCMPCRRALLRRMHALQKGLVEKDYCIALVQCICCVRSLFGIPRDPYRVPIDPVFAVQSYSLCSDCHLCSALMVTKQLHKLQMHALQKGLNTQPCTRATHVVCSAIIFTLQ